MPLLHPAHPLPAGRFGLGAGASTTRVTGIESSSAASPSERLDSAVLQAIAPEEVAPWIGGRAGVGADTEVGVATSVRALRVDARHAWISGNLALSAGAALDAVVPRPIDDGARRAVDADRVGGVGFDVPVIVGMRSDADILRGWLGVRAGYQHLSGPIDVSLDPAASEHGTLSGSQWTAGGVVGIATGLEPIWVAVELDVSAVHLTGSASLDDGTRRSTARWGAMFVPAGAIFTKF